MTAREILIAESLRERVAEQSDLFRLILFEVSLNKLEDVRAPSLRATNTETMPVSRS
jgi:hypothetical protein